jgi:uncharacterized UPF0160 family protein
MDKHHNLSSPAKVTTGVESGKVELIAATHNGMYHADDCMALALLSTVLKSEVTLSIVRTRKEELLEAADLLIDVGGKYDPEMGELDHHFVGSPTREDGSLYASAGLVLEHFAPNLRGSTLEAFIRRVDAADTGTKVANWRFSMLLSKTNPLPGSPSEEYDQRFMEIVSILHDCVIPILEDWVYDTKDEEQSIEDATRAFEEHPQVIKWIKESEDAKVESELRISAAFARATCKGSYLVELFQPEVALHDMLGAAPNGLYYVTFPSVEGTHMLQQIPVSKGSFQGRRPLPEGWAGKRGADLADVTGVQDAVFCHPGRFIAGAATHEGALRLAELAMQD